MKLRLTLLHAVAWMLNIPLTYTVKFLPLDRKRTDFRGRAVASVDGLREALDVFGDIERNPSARKEKTDGIYYLEIEAREGLVNHSYIPAEEAAPVATDGQSGLFQGLPEAEADRPAAAAATEAPADEAEGAAGLGTERRRGARAQAAAESGGPVGEVIPEGPDGPVSATPAVSSKVFRPVDDYLPGDPLPTGPQGPQGVNIAELRRQRSLAESSGPVGEIGPEGPHGPSLSREEAQALLDSIPRPEYGHGPQGPGPHGPSLADLGRR